VNRAGRPWGRSTRAARLPRTIRLTGVLLLGVGSLVWVSAAAGPTAAPALVPPMSCPASPRPDFFSDEATQLPVARPDRPGHYTLTAHLGRHSFASGWPAVPTLGYSAPGTPMNYLGPTIETRQGRPVDVTIRNALPPAGTVMFPFDQHDHGNTIVLHRHGGLQGPEDDGVPAPFQPEIPPGGSHTNHYSNDQAAGPLWYHDHTDMVTAYDMYEGLAGYMPNTDSLERTFGLPDGKFAKAYFLQDKAFNSDHTLCFNHTHAQFFGDLPVINGTIAPRQAVEPRRYTFTFVNGSDSRFFRLGLQQVSGRPGEAPRMTVVGGDSGYLYRPAPVTDLVIAPGERYTVVVDFTGHQSQQWVLSNTAAAPYPSGHPDGVDPGGGGLPQLMRFDVGRSVSSPDRSRVPDVIRETNNVLPMDAWLATARLRTVQAGEPKSGVPQLGDADRLLTYHDPVTETPELGSVEAWEMRNHTPDAHPVHEHFVEQYLVGRWHVGQWDAEGRPVPSTIGPFEPPAPYELGPKDTFISPPSYITVWVGRYTIAGVSVWHCHILSHEDGATTDGGVEMMRPLAVGHTPQTQLPLIVDQNRLDELIRQR
jgi:spore coat protein A, manganese oxidase